jgi:hypothetical protein
MDFALVHRLSSITNHQPQNNQYIARKKDHLTLMMHDA